MLDLGPRNLARPKALIAAVRCALRRLFASAAAVALADSAVAEPWLPPGDAALRADLTTLADAGVLRTPITTWPIPWKAIDEQLEAIEVAKRSEERRVGRGRRAGAAPGPTKRSHSTSANAAVSA